VRRRWSRAGAVEIGLVMNRAGPDDGAAGDYTRSFGFRLPEMRRERRGEPVHKQQKQIPASGGQASSARMRPHFLRNITQGKPFAMRSGQAG